MNSGARLAGEKMLPRRFDSRRRRVVEMKFAAFIAVDDDDDTAVGLTVGYQYAPMRNGINTQPVFTNLFHGVGRSGSVSSNGIQHSFVLSGSGR